MRLRLMPDEQFDGRRVGNGVARRDAALVGDVEAGEGVEGSLAASGGAAPPRTYSVTPIAGASPKIVVVSGPSASQPAARSTLAI